MAVARQQNRYVAGPSPSGLADVLDLILDKGLVIDLYVRVSLVGIELLTIDARIVVASVDTYLRFAEAVNRLDLQAQSDSKNLPELVEDVTEGGAKTKTKGALEGAKEKIDDAFGSDEEDEEDEAEDEEEEEEERPRRRQRQKVRRKRETRA
jgi:gas vesicle structural protein